MYEERQITYKSKLTHPREVQKFLDLINATFLEIDMALGKLNLVFADTGWKLKEGIADSLERYQDAASTIRVNLAQISMMNSTLTRFLAQEKRPIPVSVNTPGFIDKKTAIIISQLKFYFKNVRGTTFPKLDSEIQDHKNIIVKINENIDRINEINSAYKPKITLRHVKNLPNF